MTDKSPNQRLLEIWRADTGRKELLKRDWPELYELLEDAVLSAFYQESVKATEASLKADVEAGLKRILGDAYKPPAPRVVVKNGEPRCEATHDPGAWPYVKRCILPLNHERRNDHIDSDGKEWTKEQCDGCHNIERMRKNLPKNDEDAAYHFQRAARYHRKECPNR